MPAGVRVWNNGMSWGRKVGGDLCDSFLGSLHIFCYRAEDSIRGIGSGGAERDVWIC